MKKIILFIIILALAAIATSSIVSVIKDRNAKKNPPSSNSTAESQNPEASKPEPERKTINEYRVPILMYHYIRDFNDPDDQIGTNLSVSPEKFDEQLAWLKNNSYQSINPDDLANPNKKTLTQISYSNFKPVILTFDDGYKDAFDNAFPLLKKYGFTAAFYIITNYVEKNNPNYMSWDNIKELKKAGMNIGSHSLTHPDLEKVTDARVDSEIGESQEVLSKSLEIKITDFCYPTGKYDTRTIEALKKYGYKTAVTVKSGIADQNSNLFELPRIRVTNSTNLEKLLQ